MNETVDGLRAIRNEMRALGRVSAAAAIEHAIVAYLRRDVRLCEHWLALARQYDEGS